MSNYVYTTFIPSVDATNVAHLIQHLFLLQKKDDGPSTYNSTTARRNARKELEAVNILF
jgi:hypothetical protein